MLTFDHLHFEWEFYVLISEFMWPVCEVLLCMSSYIVILRVDILQTLIHIKLSVYMYFFVM